MVYRPADSPEIPSSAWRQIESIIGPSRSDHSNLGADGPSSNARSTLRALSAHRRTCAAHCRCNSPSVIAMTAGALQSGAREMTAVDLPAICPRAASAPCA